MYIENKGGELVPNPWGEGMIAGSEGALRGPSRIGRVTFSKTRRSLTYNGRTFAKANGYKANYLCETGEWFWISGPKKNGADALYATNVPTEIDEDVREEYWREIRKQPERCSEQVTR